MEFYSPLRYPGGKNKLAKFVAEICVRNDVDGHYVEPYAGGASVALFLLFNGYVKKITINDSDRSIYAFWYSIIHRTEKFCSLIEQTDVTVDNWRKYRGIQKNKKKASLFELGFSTFFLNRTNISGIINGGMIGGLEQKGKYKMDCRFNKKALIKRIREISRHKKDINMCNLDALDLIKKIKKESGKDNAIFYFDPPYYLKGASLYLNHYKHDDHLEVSEAIKGIKNIQWIVSYDDTLEIRKLYKDCNPRKFILPHTAREVKKGKEILFFSDGLIIPRLSQFVLIK